jgi:hypothetical protein
MVETKTSSG